MARSSTVRSEVGPVLTPMTAQRLVQTFSSLPSEDDSCPSDQSSPDSLYSDSSPTLPNQTFDFDFEEHDVEEADAEEGDQEEGEYRMPSWGNWPEYGVANRAWASRSNSSLQGSVLSISPRGSVAAPGRRKSSLGSAVSLRKTSLSRSIFEARRESELARDANDPSSRRSSVKSNIGTGMADRRRSSAGTSISLDPLDYSRLRHIASMNVLSRRFSEAIEITATSPTCTDDLDQPGLARRSISQWSPYTASTYDDDDDESEIHTAPFVPTPPGPVAIPAVLSNFPLASVVAAGPEDELDLSSGAPSPTFSPPRRRYAMPATGAESRALATPPPPAEPSQILRSRGRPSLHRAMTEYQFPPKGSNGVPLGATAPRIGLSRSVSVPLIPASASSLAMPGPLDTAHQRGPGSFPLQRPAALGTSPLRESVRRSSVSSVSESRRPSNGITIPGRRTSAKDRGLSVSHSATDDLRRYSFDRRMSADKRPSVPLSTSALRKESDAKQRLMQEHARRVSREGSYSASRRSSGSVPMSRSATMGSHISTSSRKSSAMSIGEYGYLAAQIDIEQPAFLPVSVAPPTAGTKPTSSQKDAPTPKKRRSARPATIVLPSYSFPALSPILGSATLTPRYSPLDSFFGRAPYEETELVDPLTPSTDIAGPEPPASEMPHVPTSVLNRRRPISPSDFTDQGYLQRWKSTAGRDSSKTEERAKVASPLLPPTIDADTAGSLSTALAPPFINSQTAESGNEAPSEGQPVDATPLIPQNVGLAEKSPKASIWDDLRTPKPPTIARTTSSPSMRIPATPAMLPDEDVSPTSSPHVEQIADLQTICAALATAPAAMPLPPSEPVSVFASAAAEIFPTGLPPPAHRPARKAVPILSEAELVKEHHIERELRNKSSIEQMRAAQRLSLGKERAVHADAISAKSARAVHVTLPVKSTSDAPTMLPARTSSRMPVSPSGPDRASSSRPPVSPIRPPNRRNATVPASLHVASGLGHGHAPAPRPAQVLGGPLYNPGNAYAGNALPRRSHIVFDLPTWRSPPLPDSSPEILASASLRDGQSFILPNTPDTTASRYQPGLKHGRPGHDRTKSSVSISSARSQPPLSHAMSPGRSSSANTTPAIGAALRPGMGRAVSFTKLFSKVKNSSSERKVGARPTSMDGLAISGLNYRM